jgi:hypothetical protein
MMPRWLVKRAVLLALVLVLLGGCRGNGPKAKLVPVRGRVVYQDQAVTAAEIYFLPDADKGNQGAMASSVLQEDGSFNMVTYPDRAGVVPGAYKVTLGLGRRPQKELDKYRTADKTPLAVVVPEEGLTDMVIELK